MNFSVPALASRMKLVRERIKLPVLFTATEASRKVQKGMVLRAQQVLQVTTPDEQETAVAVGGDIRLHLNGVEKVRKELTAPLRATETQINTVAKAHCGPLLAELERLEGLTRRFQEKERERVAEEEMKRAEAIAELDRQRHEAEMMAEAARQVGEFSKVEQLEAAAAQADDAWRDRVVAPLPEPVKAKGQATRKVLRWKVVDIHKLYAARPDLCRPPEPKPSAILAVCAAGQNVPGLELWEELDTTIRSRR